LDRETTCETDENLMLLLKLTLGKQADMWTRLDLLTERHGWIVKLLIRIREVTGSNIGPDWLFVAFFIPSKQIRDSTLN
jgi:hypothetical protein